VTDNRSLKPHASKSAPGAARPLRVLVGDDERDAANTLLKLLYHEGYDVRAAYDGAEVLHEAREFHPDVVILDIGMPQLSGYDVTGWKQSTDKILARMAGFDHHFGKPCDPRAILELLGKLKHP
jgi:DNA-binding response OmpR family regulator